MMKFYQELLWIQIIFYVKDVNLEILVGIKPEQFRDCSGLGVNGI